MLAVVREGALVKGLHHHLHLLLEQLPVGVLVYDWVAKALDLTGVVTPANAEDDPPSGQDVGGRVVLRQSQRVPHRVDVEAAAESEVLRDMGQVDEQHQQVGQALVALVLEVVLGGPEVVVSQPVHCGDYGLRLGEDAGELIVGKAAIIDGCPRQADVVHVQVAGE